MTTPDATREAGPGAATDTAAPDPAHRVLRHRRGAVVAGVAGGVADHLGVPVLRVRVVFTLLCALGGAGVLAYGGLWACCAMEPAGTEREVDDRDRIRGYGLVALGLALALVLSAVGDQISGWVLGPLGIALVGAAVVWREADGDAAGGSRAGRRGRPRIVAGRGGVLRAVLGAVLVAGGITVFLLGRLDIGAVQFGLLAATATLAGVVVLTVPWWMRLARELTAERRERIRSEERAEIAAHLHDSVLQTLALIQRHTETGDDAPAVREVRRLARRQERELREWLYGEREHPAGPEEAGADPAAAACFGAALRAAAGEVEDAFAVTVAPVVVGDAAHDARTAALVAAAREAMVNAAKHAGVDEISVYAEVEDPAGDAGASDGGEVAVFVRDRGCGFDPEAVPADRHGLADSIRARVERHGGTVRLRTAPGEGTEVALVLPRAAPAPENTDRTTSEVA